MLANIQDNRISRIIGLGYSSMFLNLCWQCDQSHYCHVYIFITICIVIFLFRSNARISIPNNKGASVFLVQHFFGPICPPTKESQTRTDLPVAFTCAQSGRMIAPYIYTRSICFRVSSSSSHSLRAQLRFASRYEPHASLHAAPYLGARRSRGGRLVTSEDLVRHTGYSSLQREMQSGLTSASTKSIAPPPD
jgi:hypothetical protein